MALDAVVIGSEIVGLLTPPELIYSEQHTRKLLVTAHPVQSGVRIPDHAVQEADKLTLMAVWTSLSLEGAKTNLPSEGWAALGVMMQALELTTVHTLLGSYTDMMIVKLDTTMDAQTGENLFATIQLQEIRQLGANLASGANEPITTISSTVNARTGPASNRGGVQENGEQVTQSVTATPEQLQQLRGG